MISSTKEKLIKCTERVFRRERIKTGLQNNAPLRRIIEDVRGFEKDKNTKEALFNAQIADVEYLVDPTLAQVADEIASELSIWIAREFPMLPELHPSVVLMGSGAHGGAIARKLQKGLGSPDLDWALLLDEIPSEFSNQKEILSEIVKGAEVCFITVAKKLKLNREIRSCDSLSPKYYFLRNLQSVQHLEKLLDLYKAVYNYSDIPAKFIIDVLTYFEPSFPKVRNALNRKIVLEFLNELFKKDPFLWQKVVTKLHLEHVCYHRMKHKHFSYTSNAARNLAFKIDAVSGKAMSGPFLRLIESTSSNNFVPPENPEYYYIFPTRDLRD